MRTFRKIPMPFLAFTGAVVCSSKKIGEPYFCYYRLLPQVARTYLCTRNLSDSPFLEKGGHDHTSHVHAVALDYPNNTKSWNRKEHDHTSSVHAVAPSRWKPKIDGSPIPPRRTWRFQKCCTPVWLVFSGRTRMQRTTPPGSVQLQDYYIHPEKMGASRKDLADAIQSYSDNDSQKNGEPFFKSLSAFASDPRRRANAPVNTYSALSNRSGEHQDRH